MTTPELKATFVGNTASGENGRGFAFTRKFYPDGNVTASGFRRKGMFDRKGKWKIANGMICSEYTDGRGGCHKYYRVGDKFYRTRDGDTNGWVTVKKGL